VAISLVVCAFAEPAIDLLSITNCGKVVAGVQLSVSFPTNVVEIGSTDKEIRVDPGSEKLLEH